MQTDISKKNPLLPPHCKRSNDAAKKRDAGHDIDAKAAARQAAIDAVSKAE